MNPLDFRCAVLLALLVATGAQASVRNVTDADAPRSLPADGHVDVRWQDPSGFTELRQSGNRFQSRRGNWVQEVAAHVRKRGEARLPEGQRLEVEITDIRRAGRYEPTLRGHDIRVVRDIYPPAIDLPFRLLGADGAVIAQGERKLRDLAFMQRGTAVGGTDTLHYEKALIDAWLRRELADATTGDTIVGAGTVPAR